MKHFLLCFFTFFIFNSNAQDKFSFNSQNTIGLLEGGSGSAFQLQTINGISQKNGLQDWEPGLIIII